LRMTEEDGYTPLHVAVLRRDIAAATAALDAPGCDPLAMAESGDAAIHLAAMCCDEPMIRLLLDRTSAAAANMRRSTDGAVPIVLAAFAGNVATTRALLGTADDGTEQRAIVAALCDHQRGVCLAWAGYGGASAAHAARVICADASPPQRLICAACGRLGDAGASPSFFPARRCDACHLTVCAACLPDWTRTRDDHVNAASLLADDSARRMAEFSAADDGFIDLDYYVGVGRLFGFRRSHILAFASISLCDRFDRPRVHRRIGRRGTTYRATQRGQRGPVAVKMLAGEWSDAGLAIWRGLQPGADDHVARLIDYDLARGDDRYIAMEYCDYGDLGAVIREQGKICERDALAFTFQLVRALEYLRRQRVVHRAIAPSNVLMRLAGDHYDPKLSDFGEARLLPPSSDIYIGWCEATPCTAPELLSVGRASLASDLWSLGAVLHNMVTGRPLCRGSTRDELVAEVASWGARAPSAGVDDSGPCGRLLRGLLSLAESDRTKIFERAVSELSARGVRV